MIKYLWPTNHFGNPVVEESDISLKTAFIPLNREVGDAGKIRFTAVTPGFGDFPAFARSKNWEMFEGVVLSVGFVDKECTRVLGSAVLVAPGIALSAKHVFDDDLQELVAGNVSALCVGIATHGAMIWKVRTGTIIDGTDLCLLTLEYVSEIPRNREIHMACLTTKMPKAGERVYIAGFIAAENAFPHSGSRDDTINVGQSLHVSHGLVLEVYPTGTGSLRPWPQFVVDCALLGGMSGGPAFDANGRVIGIAYASYDIGTDRLPDTTFVSLLPPALGFPFVPSWPAELQAFGTTSLIQMAGRFCQIDRPEAIEFHLGGKLIKFKPWS